jgi:hypothetical protein
LREDALEKMFHRLHTVQKAKITGTLPHLCPTTFSHDQMKPV